MHARTLVAIGLVTLGACRPTKQEWIEKFEAMLPERMCAPDFIFVHCYEIDTAACRALVAPIAHECTAKIADQLPDHMNEELGGKYGAIAGTCVSTEVGTKLDDKVRQPIDPKCQDPMAWH